MDHNTHDWIVLHRVRFAQPIDGTRAPFAGPQQADAWRFYPASPLGADGLRTNVSDEWGGIGIYDTQDAAQAVFDNPQDHLGFLGDTVEAYHALVVPYSHRGQVNWRGEVRENDTFTPISADPGGPLVVFTSAGYDNPGPAELPRIANFLRQVDEVQAYFATLPANIRRAVFSGATVDGHDGITVSIWRDEGSMIDAAYKAGLHREQMDYHRKESHFDRSSFTRARILASKGSWDGADPVLSVT